MRTPFLHPSGGQSHSIGHKVMSKNIFSTQDVKNQATRLEQYLTTRGVNVSRQQALEGVCRAVHGRPWNVVRTLATDHAQAPAASDARPALKAVYFTYEAHAGSGVRKPLAVLAQRWHQESGCSETVNINVQLHQMTDDEVLDLFKTQGTTAWLKLPGRREAHPREAEGKLMLTSSEAQDSFAQWIAAFRPHLLWDYLCYRFYAGPKSMAVGLLGLTVQKEKPDSWFVQMAAKVRSHSPTVDVREICRKQHPSQAAAEMALSQVVLSGVDLGAAMSICKDEATLDVVMGSGQAEEYFAEVVVPGRKDQVTGAPLVLEAGMSALTSKELKHITEDGKYYLDVVMLMSISQLMEGIESADDRVAERITGSVADLQDIAFEAAPVDLDLPQPPSDNIWMRVVADWSPAEYEAD